MALSLPRRSSPKTVVGLDIEAGAIHAAQVSATGRLQVQRAATVALEPGVVRDGEVVDSAALTTALRELFAEHKLDKRVRVGVANQRIVVRHLLLPMITGAKEIAAAVRFQAGYELPMPIEQAVLDHVVLGPVETDEGERMRVLVVAARRDVVEQLLDAVRAAGLAPVGIDLSVFALARALGRHAGDECTVHLAIGGIVNLAVVHEGECLFTRVIGGGVEAMALELAEREEITAEEARAALHGVDLRKRSAPATAPLALDPDPVVELEPVHEPVPVVQADAEDEHVPVVEIHPVAGFDQEAEAERPVEPPPAARRSEPSTADVAERVVADGIRRIAADVRNSLDFHQNAELPGASAPPVPQRILLTGPAVGIPGFADALADRVGLSVEVVDIDMRDGLEPGHYTVAAGLAIEEAIS